MTSQCSDAIDMANRGRYVPTYQDLVDEVAERELEIDALEAELENAQDHASTAMMNGLCLGFLVSLAAWCIIYLTL